MGRLMWLSVLLLLASALASARAMGVGYGRGGIAPFEYVPGEMLIKFRDDTRREQKQHFATSLGGNIVSSVPELGIYKITLPAHVNVPALASFVRIHPSVVFAEPNGIVRVAWPDDPFYSDYQWNLPRIGWPSAMSVYRGKPSAVIAIVDTGVSLTHQDLQAKIVSSGWDFVNNDAIADDDHQHGTHVAGIAAAATNNGLGIAGVNPSAMLLPVKVLDSTGRGSWENVARGITYAVNHDAHVVNLSLAGTTVPPASVRTALQYAVSSGVVVVAAAGNQNSYFPVYPAGYEECIAVGASTSGDFRAGLSNYNRDQYQWVDVAAPGASVFSCYLGNTYGYDNGTSMASPHVAGQAALLYAALTEPLGVTPRSSQAASLVRQLIESNCVLLYHSEPGTNRQVPWTTYGRIKLNDALAAALALPATLSGKVILEAHVEPERVPVTIQLFQPGTSNLVAWKVVTLASDGSYATTFATPGVYDVRFSTAVKFLARRVPSVALSRVAAASTTNVTLPNGDVDGSGVVDLSDLSAILVQFSRPGSADLTGDGVVDLGDLAVALASYSKRSDP